MPRYHIKNYINQNIGELNQINAVVINYKIYNRLYHPVILYEDKKDLHEDYLNLHNRLKDSNYTLNNELTINSQYLTHRFYNTNRFINNYKIVSFKHVYNNSVNNNLKIKYLNLFEIYNKNNYLILELIYFNHIDDEYLDLKKIINLLINNHILPLEASFFFNENDLHLNKKMLRHMIKKCKRIIKLLINE